MHVFLIATLAISLLLPAITKAFIITYHSKYQGFSYTPENESEWKIIKSLDSSIKVEIIHNHKKYVAFIPWNESCNHAYELNDLDDENPVQSYTQAASVISCSLDTSGACAFTPVTTSLFFASNLLSTVKAHTSSKTATISSKKKTLCRNYLNGFCKYKNCKFQHLKSCIEAPTICLSYLNSRCQNKSCNLTHIDDESEIPKEIPKCADCQAYGHKSYSCPY